VRVEEDVDQEGFDGGKVGHNLVILAVRIVADFGQLQTIEGRFAGQGRPAIRFASPLLSAGIVFANRRSQQGIEPQTIVVVQVFIAASQPVNSLPQQIEDRVLRGIGIAMIGKASGETLKHPVDPIHLSEQGNAAVATDIAALKVGRDGSGIEVVKFNAIWGTLCWHEVAFRICLNGLLLFAL
jgi:hypothetical protein